MSCRQRGPFRPDRPRFCPSGGRAPAAPPQPVRESAAADAPAPGPDLPRPSLGGRVPPAPRVSGGIRAGVSPVDLRTQEAHSEGAERWEYFGPAEAGGAGPGAAGAGCGCPVSGDGLGPGASPVSALRGFPGRGRAPAGDASDSPLGRPAAKFGARAGSWWALQGPRGGLDASPHPASLPSPRRLRPWCAQARGPGSRCQALGLGEQRRIRRPSGLGGKRARGPRTRRWRGGVGLRALRSPALGPAAPGSFGGREGCAALGDVQVCGRACA